MQACPVPGCKSVAVCVMDHSGNIFGNCRGCQWVGSFPDSQDVTHTK